MEETRTLSRRNEYQGHIERNKPDIRVALATRGNGVGVVHLHHDGTIVLNVGEACRGGLILGEILDVAVRRVREAVKVEAASKTIGVRDCSGRFVPRKVNNALEEGLARIAILDGIDWSIAIASVARVAAGRGGG